jgi:hypothetical protein
MVLAIIIAPVAERIDWWIQSTLTVGFDLLSKGSWSLF